MPDAPRFLHRLRDAKAIHPHGPTPVSELVAAELATSARRRARRLAWAGLLVNLPLFYIDDWLNYTGSVMADPLDGVHAFGIFVWRVVAVLTLGVFLVVERRAPPGVRDERWASGLAVWFTLLGGWFGAYFVTNAPSYALYGLTLLVVAVLVHSPTRGRLLAYPAAFAVALLGALALGAPPLVVVEWVAPFVLLTVFAVFVDRALYLQTYRNAEAGHLLSRANAELSATLAELRETQGRLVEAERQAERTRISRDLHDSVGAQLSSLLAGVELARLGRQSGTGVGVTLDDVESDAREALQQLRETVWVLNTAEITVEGLAAQLRRFAESRAGRAGMHAAVTAEGDRYATLPSAHALQLYRIGQEAVQNAVKHSGGRAVSVQLVARGGRVVLRVEDDGAFRPPVPVSGDGAPSGFGMRTMRERAEGLGGSLDVDTARGVTVEASVPLDGVS